MSKNGRTKTKVVNMRAYGSRGVKRADRNTPFGNPFRIGPDGTREDVVRKHKEWLEEWIYYGKEIVVRGAWNNKWVIEHLEELRGLIIGCWCKPEPCHVDTLIELLERKK